MKLSNIRMVSNGFILTDDFDSEHISKTLVEAAQLAGEFLPPEGASRVVYHPYRRADNLATVRELAREGRKSEAIKELCDCFSPRLGLKEAKDLIEQLCEV